MGFEFVVVCVVLMRWRKQGLVLYPVFFFSFLFEREREKKKNGP